MTSTTTGVTLSSKKGLIWQPWFRFVHYLIAGCHDVVHFSWGFETHKTEWAFDFILFFVNFFEFFGVIFVNFLDLHLQLFFADFWVR